MIFTERLVVVECCKCAVPFGLPEYVEKCRRQDAATFYCPMGHPQHFPFGKTEADKLRDQVADLTAARDREASHRRTAEAEVKRIAADALRLKQKQGRAERRQRAGTCPCCQRTFVAMARHMKTKHPGFGK